MDATICQRQLQEIVDLYANRPTSFFGKLTEYGIKQYLMDRMYPQRLVRVIDKPFAFVHFTSRYGVEAAQKRGLAGRHIDMLPVFKIMSPYVLSEGVLFAYMLRGDDPKQAKDLLFLEIESILAEADQESDNPNLVAEKLGMLVLLDNAIFGVASAGVELHRDDETQYVIPISCIDQSSLIYLSGLYEKYPTVFHKTFRG